jgi:hypothetical protein
MGKDNAASVEKKQAETTKGKLLDFAPHVPSRQVDNSTFFLSAIMYLCPPMCAKRCSGVCILKSPVREDSWESGNAEAAAPNDSSNARRGKENQPFRIVQSTRQQEKHV